MSAAHRALLIRLSSVTLLFGVAGMYMKSVSHSEWYLPAFPLLLLLFAAIYFFFSWSLLPPRTTSSKQFINRFILFTGIKLLFLLVLIITWLLLNRENPARFLTYVIILYFGFSMVSYSLILSKKNYTK